MLNRTLSPTPSHSHLRLIREEDSPVYDGDWQVSQVELVEPGPTPKREPFVMVPAAVGRTVLGTLGPSAFAVYWHLTMRAKDGQCWPSLDDIAEGTKQSRKHVTRMLDALETGGWITRQKRANEFGFATSTLYTITRKARTDGCDIDETLPRQDVDVNVTRTRVELDTNQKSIKTPKSPATMTSIPDDFAPTPEMVQKACHRYRVSLDWVTSKTDRFRDWAISKNRKYADWDRAWMNFMEPKPWEQTTANNRNGHSSVPDYFPPGVDWDDINEWRIRRGQGASLPEERIALLDRLDLNGRAP